MESISNPKLISIHHTNATTTQFSLLIVIKKDCLNLVHCHVLYKTIKLNVGPFCRDIYKNFSCASFDSGALPTFHQSF